jgi:hypothetical protein
MNAPPVGSVNHWEDYGGLGGHDFSCKETDEHCHVCGRQLVEHFEVGMFKSRRTGGPTYERLHSCPTWVVGWKTRWGWTRALFLPGYGGHDSHDADNPMSSRGYR